MAKDNNLKPDGATFQFTAKMLPPNIHGKFEKLFDRGDVFAVPLTSIKNPEDVYSEIKVKRLSRLKE